MAKKKDVVPVFVDNVEALEAKMQAMREAQKIFATYTQEQVDKIFYAAAVAANKMRIPLAKQAVEETGRGCSGRSSESRSTGRNHWLDRCTVTGTDQYGHERI